MSFLIREKVYLIYNLSSLYQSVKIKSNQIKIINNQDSYNFEGDFSNLKSKIDLSKFSALLNKNMRGIVKEGLVISSNNKFSFNWRIL